MRTAIRLATLSAALTVLFAATSAKAASNTARNRCSDAVRILRSNPTMSDLKQDIDPTEVKGAIAHYNQVVDGWNRAVKQFDQVPADELKSGDADLADCVAEKEKWRFYVVEFRKKIDAANELSKTVVPFLAEVKPYKDSFVKYAALALDPTLDIINGGKVEEAKKAMSDLAAVEKSCTTYVPNAGTKSPTAVEESGSVRRVGNVTIGSAFLKNPDNWCYVAKTRKDLLIQASANRHFHVEGYGAYKLLFPEAIQKLDKNPDMEAWMAVIVVDSAPFLKALKAARTSWYKDLEIEEPSDASAPVEAQIAALRAKVDEVAKELSFPSSGPHESWIEKKAGTALLKIFPKASLKRSVMDSADWTINKNALDVPIERFRSGQILFKRAGTQWCEQRTFSYVEPYAGGGKYAPASSAQILAATRFVKCP